MKKAWDFDVLQDKTLRLKSYKGLDKAIIIPSPIIYPSSAVVLSAGAYLFAASPSPDAPISIDEYAFDECSALTDITIPDSVIEISPSAFDACCNLTIHGTHGSYAKSMPKKKIPFEAL